MGLNILIVDDLSLMRSMIQRIIRLSGLDAGRLLFAENGADALHVMDAHRIDLVVTDLNMPVMDGYTMIQIMKERDILCGIPVLVVSTECGAARLETLRAQGVAGMIQKPFAPEDLVRAVKHVACAPAGSEVSTAWAPEGIN